MTLQNTSRRLIKSMCVSIGLTAGSILEYSEALRHESESILDDLATIRDLAGWSDDDVRP